MACEGEAPKRGCPQHAPTSATHPPPPGQSSPWSNDQSVLSVSAAPRRLQPLPKAKLPVGFNFARGARATRRRA